jgi:hypothetical protein
VLPLFGLLGLPHVGAVHGAASSHLVQFAMAETIQRKNND